MNAPLRKDITAADLDALYARVDRLVEGVGLETQPRVAVRLMQLAQNPNAQLRDYAEVLRTDAALTGRLLKLANSAHFAQIHPVTRLDRALVLLGVERTKAVSLGFSLSRAAGADQKALSKKVWGESVYRASLAASMARQLCPGHVPEAFVIGLMLDAGQPVMGRLLGDEYHDLFAANATPAKLFAAENEQLPYTHVDVVASLTRRWKLPDQLARPILDHHRTPPKAQTSDPIDRLVRIAHYAGTVQLGQDHLPRVNSPHAALAAEVLGCGTVDLSRMVQGASGEYRATIGMFDGIADPLTELERVAELVQAQLVATLDEHISKAVRAERGPQIERFVIGDQTIEIEPGDEGEVIAYLSAVGGERLISATVNPRNETPESICRMLGVEDAQATQVNDLMRAMRQMAA